MCIYVKIAYKVHDEFQDKYIKKLDDSTLKVTFRYQLSDCTFLYLLSFGEYVEIIEPVEAKNILKEKAKKIFDILKISQPNGNKITVIQLTLRRF
ncbi:WYL domain-containing protein [Bilophila wadsworthia]|uniref:WYL domain-containing protein n=1 Tax=Bilophila wadsworthia TaxID=35833 RepID=UPI003D2FAE93